MMKFLKYLMPAKEAEKPDYFTLWLKALGFAKDAHGAQVIPGTEMPYILHPVAVFETLKPCITASNQALLVPVALLHDTIEDTNVTHEDLAREFGQSVADGVLALTKNMDLSKAERMPDSIRRIQAQPRPIWMVKLADRIVNLQPPPYFWKPKKNRGVPRRSQADPWRTWVCR